MHRDVYDLYDGQDPNALTLDERIDYLAARLGVDDDYEDDYYEDEYEDGGRQGCLRRAAHYW